MSDTPGQPYEIKDEIAIFCPTMKTGQLCSSGTANILKLNSMSHGPIARLGNTDDDIAPLIAFLVGPEAGFLTGYTYMLDGGSAIDAAR